MVGMARARPRSVGAAVLPAAAAITVALATAACTSGSAPRAPGTARPSATARSSTAAVVRPAAGRRAVTSVPRPRHTVVVMLENHAYGEIIGNPQARFINRLARRGALFTASFAITHPSEPNYLALFSGSTHGVVGDPCPTSVHGPNLAADLIAVHLTFAGYSEGLPAPGSKVCAAGEYARKHVPWADFPRLPRTVNLPFSRFPARNFRALPSLSFVIPNLCHDMHVHDCSVATGDAWLKAHIAAYATWAMTHDSLLVVTFDEDDGSQNNQIATIFVGQQVRPGRYHARIDHYTVLRTIEQAYGLRHDGHAARRHPITWIWRQPG
jgi:phosphatidylinositol-3-phosphatase